MSTKQKWNIWRRILMNNMLLLPQNNSRLKLTKRKYKKLRKSYEVYYYSGNPTNFDGLRFKIQTQGLENIIKKLHKQLET
jgi:hypothetical protein